MASFGHPTTIQAAAQELTAAEAAPSGRVRRDKGLDDPVEATLWKYWEELGEISFPAQTMSNVARLVSYFPAMLPTGGDELSDPEQVEDRRILDVWNEIGGEQQIAEWVSDLITHYWVPGQAWLAATEIRGGKLRLVDPDAEGVDAEWVILSTDDLLEAGGWKKINDVPVSDARFWRLFKPSKRKRSMPDSPVRHVKTDCEMLLLYKYELLASSRGRQAAGIKTLPARLKDEPLENGKTYDEQLYEDLNAAKNPQSPASLHPIYVYVESKDEADIINAAPAKLADPKSTEDLLAKIEAAVQRIAIGLDWPTEMLQGMGDVNHWTSWLLQRQNYEYHLDPMIVRILGDLTQWFRARLQAANIEASRVVLWRNPDSAVTNPNAWEQSTYLYEHRLISDEAMRTKADIGDAEAPDETEYLRRLLEQIIIANPGLISNLPGVGEVIGVDLAPQGIPESTNPAESDDMPMDKPGVVQAATQPELVRLADTLARIDQTLLIDAEQAVGREAGRLQRVLKSRVAAAARASGRDNVDEDTIGEELGVAAVLALLGLPDVESLVPLGDVRTDRVDRAIANAQTETDRTLARVGAQAPAVREQDRNAAVAALSVAMAAAVARSLFKRPTPQGESSLGGNDIVPMADVRQALDVAGGGAAARTADGEEAWELVANGRHTVTALDQSGIGTAAFQWVYGTSPRNTFEPHLRLDGAVFDRWDSDELSQDGTGGEWVGGTHFYPGDHRGCRCSYRRVLVDRAGTISLAASARG